MNGRSELWVTDFTAAKTKMVTDLVLCSGGAIPVPNSPPMNGIEVLFHTFSFDPQQLAKSLMLSSDLHWTPEP